MPRKKTQTRASWASQYDRLFRDKERRLGVRSDSYADYELEQLRKNIDNFGTDLQKDLKQVIPNYYIEDELEDYRLKRREISEDAAEDFISDVKNPLKPGGLLTKFAYNAAKGALKTAAVEDPRKPEGYGYFSTDAAKDTLLKDIASGKPIQQTVFDTTASFLFGGQGWKDAWSDLMQQINDYQALSFLGRMDRASHAMGYLDQYEQYLKAVDSNNLLMAEAALIESYIKDPNITITATQADYSIKRLDEIQDLISNNNKVIEETKQSEDIIKQYQPSWLGVAVNNAINKFGKGNYLFNNPVTGNLPQLHDDTNDIYTNIYDITNPSLTTSLKIRKINDARKEYDRKMEEWKKGALDNLDDKKWYENVHHVSDWYKLKQQEGSGNIFDWDTYKYNFSGILAGTASGAAKIGLGVMAGLGGAAVGSAAGGPVGAAGGFLAGAGASFGFNRSASIDENSIEVADTQTNKIKRNLLNKTSDRGGSLYNQLISEGKRKLRNAGNLTDDQIFEAFRYGLFSTDNKDIQKEIFKAGVGIENQFQDEMVATLGSDAIQTALDITPIGSLGKMISKPGVKFATGRFFVNHPNLRSSYTYLRNNGFINKAGAAAAVSSTFGPAGTVVGGTLGSVAAVSKPLWDPIIDMTSGLFGKLGESIGKKLQLTPALVRSLDAKKILTRLLKNSTRTKYLTSLGGRILESSFVEGFEEGSQGYAQRKMLNDEYTDKEKSIISSIIDDALNKAKSAELLLTDTFGGVLPKEDAELLKEIKMGMIGGGVHTGVITTGISAPGYIRETSANDILIQNIFADKLYRVDTFNKASKYAQLVRTQDGLNSVLTQIDKLSDLNDRYKSDNDEYGIDPSVLEDHKDMVKRVAAVAQNEITRKQARDLGIEPSKRKFWKKNSFKKDYFNKFVALKYLAEQDLNDARDSYRESLNELKLARIPVEQDFNEYTKTFLNQLFSEDGELNASTLEEMKLDPEELSFFANYVALLKTREKYNFALQEAKAAGNNKKVKRINNLLDLVTPRINQAQELIKKFVSTDDEDFDINNIEDVQNLVVDNIDLHNQLVDAYSNLLVKEADYKLAQSEYERVVGKPKLRKTDESGKVTTVDIQDELKGVTDQSGWIADNFKNIVFEGGEASKLIDEFEKIKRNDEDFDRAVQETHEEEKRQQQAAELPEAVQEEQQQPAEVQPEPPTPDDIAETPQELEPVQQPETQPAEQPSETLNPEDATVTITLDEPSETSKEQKRPYVKPAVRQTVANLTDKQKAVLDKIQDYVKYTKENLKHITGQDYFFEIDGKLVRMSRVHSIIDLSFKQRDDQISKYKDTLLRLKLAVQDGNVVETILTLQKEFDLQHSSDFKVDLTPYIDYIELNDVLSQADELNVVIDHISKIISHYLMHASVHLGTATDEVMRALLGNPNLDAEYRYNRDELLLNVALMESKDLGGKTLNELFLSDDHLDELLIGTTRVSNRFIQLVEDAVAIYRDFKQRGYVLSTDEVVWFNNFKKYGYVAGATDMLAIAPDGTVEIIDFKTSKTRLDSYKVGDVEVDNLRSVSSWLNISKYEEYSQQQTAYYEMLLAKLGNVSNVYILPLTVEYDTDGSRTKVTYVYHITNRQDGNVVLIPLELSLKLKSELAGEDTEESVEIVSNQPSTEPETPVIENIPTTASDEITLARNKRGPRGEEHTNLNYDVVEHNRELSAATNAYDFITNSTIELYVKHGRLYAKIEYGGRTYDNIPVDTHLGPKGTALFNKVLTLLSQLKAGLKVIATIVSRTNGRIIVRPKSVVKNTDLVADLKIQDITFDTTLSRFGYVKDGELYTINANRGNSSTSIYSWNQLGLTPPENGTIVYLKPIFHQEKQNVLYIPISLDRTKLTPNDSQFILNCLMFLRDYPDSLDKPFFTEINGQVHNVQATMRLLINTLIPIINLGLQINPKLIRIERDALNANIFRLVDPSGELVTQEEGFLDLTQPVTFDRFKKALEKVSIVDRSELLNQRLGSNNVDLRLPFAGIKKFFGQSNKHGITSLALSDNIKFDINDFRNVQTSNGTTVNGITMLAWMIKNGTIISEYGGLAFANVEIEDCDIVDGTNKPDVTKLPTPETLEIDGSAEIDMSLFGGVFKILREEDKHKPKLVKEVVIQHIAEILGEDAINGNAIAFSEEFAKMTPFGSAVGVTASDGVTLYTGAFEGVDWHESLHRILELIIDPKRRDAIYEQLAKELGVLDEYHKELEQVKEGTPLSLNSAHRLIAEYAADTYMDLMNKRVDLKHFKLLSKILNRALDWGRILWNFKKRNLYKLYLDVNKGKFRNYKGEILQENKKRFDEIFKELYFVAHGTALDNIVDQKMYDLLIQTAAFAVMYGQNIDSSGTNISDLKIDANVFKRGVDTILTRWDVDILGQKSEERTVGQEAMREIYEKFDGIKDDIANALSSFSTEYKKIYQEDEDIDLDNQGSTGESFGEHTKASYEFDRFDKASARVKFFFSTIPMYEYVYKTLVEEGKKRLKKVPTLKLNELGMPEFIPQAFVYNQVLSNLHMCDSIEEILELSAKLAQNDPMFGLIYRKIYDLNKQRSGEKPDYDAESFLIELVNNIRSNRYTFMQVRAMKLAGEEALYNIILERTDSDYNAKEYTRQWSQNLSKGGTEILKINSRGRLVFNPKIPNVSSQFRAIASLFDQIKTKLSDLNINTEERFIKVKMLQDGKLKIATVDPKLPYQFEIVKDKIVQALNYIGIRINTDEFNYMLSHKYGSTDYEAIKLMFESLNKDDSMSSFINFLNRIVINNGLNLSYDGKYVKDDGKSISLDNIYTDFAFVKELANWKYNYRHSRDQLTVLATKGNRFYEISDNDYMSDVIRELNKRGKLFSDLLQDDYNYFKDEEGTDAFGETPVYGSIALQQLVNDPSKTLSMGYFAGFKTDKKGDLGQDYFDITRREDYLSKAVILENGGVILLTLSDKKKYAYVNGIKLPGIDYNDPSTLATQTVLPKSKGSFVRLLDQKAEVVDQFISYAFSEYRSAKNADAKLDQLEKDGKKDEATVNYYTEELGAKFSSLLGVYVNKYDKDGNIIGEDFISFNEGNDRKQNLATAEKYFFGNHITHEQRQAMILRILNDRLLDELKTAESLGLIERVKEGDDHENSIPFYRYRNRGLNQGKISQIENELLSRYPNADDINKQRLKSLALCIYLNDICVKAIMSGLEDERIFSGNPAYYEWHYDSKGRLIDRTVNELKRLGGLGSTGTNIFTDLNNIPSKYVEDGHFSGKYICAEVDNQIVLSSLIDLIKQRMYESELRSAVYDYETQSKLDEEFKRFLKELFAIANSRFENDSLREEALRTARENHKLEIANINTNAAEIASRSIKELEESYPQLSELSTANGNENTDSFRYDEKHPKRYKGIDVADGAAYITDEMCEMLLRMDGKYTNDVAEAFDILRGRKPSNYLELSQAYKKVVTTVIGTLKYTAFGRRMEDGIAAVFYHKYALFPIFESIATGPLANIFKAMRDLKVDMMLINSAVKVGSRGSKPIKFSDYSMSENDGKPEFSKSFKFNTYESEFKWIRKQLNTDPKDEAEMMNMGTQATKVAMSNLLPGREYTAQNGTKYTGQQLLDRIMSAINAISDMGVDKINKEFFKTNENGDLIDEDGNVIEDPLSDKKVLDIKKFSKKVSSMMAQRGADLNLLRALEVSKDGNSLNVPLGAISNANWLESVLISYINGEVIDIETPGAAFIQRSVYGMEGLQMFDRDGISYMSTYNGKELKMENDKDGSMDVLLSIDIFKDIIPKDILRDSDGNIVYQIDESTGKFKLDKKGNRIPVMVDKSFNDARKWLIANKIIGEDAVANMMAYRIPTQALSSIHAMRCLDVLPVVRDTIIMPKEITKITGSDFDIDKMFISMLLYRFVDGKITDEFEENTKGYYQNRLIKDYLTLLLDPDSMNLTHRSIDNDTKLLKDVLKDIEGSSDQPAEKPYGFYTLATQTERKNDYITGKIGIGPFALNNNNHILTMMYNVHFKDIKGSIMSTLNLTSLARRKDVDNKSIMSWISALINAHVDIAKDPYISRLNVNKFTYNLVNTLIRTGFGKNTFYFTTQPIMKALADTYNVASSSYMSDSHKSIYTIQREAINKLVEDLFNGLEIPGIGKFEFIIESLGHPTEFKVSSEKISNAFKDVVNSGVLRQSAKDNNKITDESKKYSVGDITYNNKQLQALMYLSYLLFEPYATSLSSLVKYSKIDTKKHGKSVLQQIIFEDGYRNLFFGEGGLFDEETLLDMVSNSYIQTKTDNAITLTRQILGQQFLQSTPEFMRIIREIQQAIGRPDLSEKLGQDISKAIMAAIKSEFINNEYVKTISDNPTYIHDLVSSSKELVHVTSSANSNVFKLEGTPKYSLTSYVGNEAQIKGADGNYHSVRIVEADDENNTVTLNINASNANSGINLVLLDGRNTIFDRFSQILVDILTKDEYSDMRDATGDPKNELLRNLVPGKTWKYSKFGWQGEQQDTYSDLNFIKLFNALNEQGVVSNYIIDAWDQLLHDDSHPELKKFAEDLVVYAFVTSGDLGGFTKFFKLVPLSWREESGYADFILKKIEEFLTGRSNVDIDDIILNNWFNGSFIPTIYEKDRETKADNFIGIYDHTSYPLLIAGLKYGKEGLTPTIEGIAPRFIKIPRRKDAIGKESQRRYTVYRLYGYGQRGNVEYPIYIKVNPKGNQLNGNYLMTEYGRSDRISVKEQEFNPKLLDYLIDLVDSSEFEQQIKNYPSDLRSVVKDLHNFKAINNGEDLIEDYTVKVDEGLMQQEEEDVSSSTNKPKWIRAQSYYSRQSVQNDPRTLYIFTDNTDRTSGGLEYGEGWYKDKYGTGGFGSYNNPTSAQIRGLDNAAPISTMRYFYKNHPGMTHPKYDQNSEARWHDKDFDEFVKVFDDEIEQIKKLWDTGRFDKIVSPVGDQGKSPFFGSKLTEITPQRTPKIYEYMINKFKELQDYVNGSTQNSTEANSYVMQSGGAPLNISEFERLLGRKRINSSDSKYITEQLYVRIKGENYDNSTLQRFLQVQNEIVDILFNTQNDLTNNYVSIPYYEWKQMLSTRYNIFGKKEVINQFEFFIEHDLLPALVDGDWVNENDERYHKYDKQSKIILIPYIEYELVKLLSLNLDYLKFIYNINQDSAVEDVLTISRNKYNNVSEMISKLVLTSFHDGFEDDLSNEEDFDINEYLLNRNININYTYRDSRQMELFLSSLLEESDKNSSNNKPFHETEFSPDNIEDAVAKSLTSKQDNTTLEPDENGVILGKLGVDKSQLIALLGNTMYTASVQEVAEKELVQNAFDATKIAIAQGLIKKGKITVELDSKQRTVTITDNGSGMTPEIVLKAFFTIGGSYKGENTDNRLKSGGLGLAKMAFLFTADYVELTTVKDGKKVYVKATPQLIQNDDFKIIVSSTNEPNGTSVSVKVPETYLDQEGNERSIHFSTWGDGFFNNPMIGNVEVTRIVDGKERWTRDFNKIPEGYTMIGTATSDFGDIEIYKDFSHETSNYKVLISGLYLFYDWVNSGGTHYATIINILPSVGTKSEVYPINNQREGFRSTIRPEIEDLEYFLEKLDNLFERKKLKTSFGSSFNMDSESLENIELKSDVTTEDLIKEVLNDIKQQYKPVSTKTSNRDNDSESFGIKLNTLTEERKESEKKRRSSFDTSSIPIEELNQYVDTSNLDLLKAVFYNNTTFKPSKNTIEFLTLFGSMLIQLRNSFLALQSNNAHYKAVAENMKTLYWGVAIDKNYNGVNVSPSLFNFLGLNPISMANMILKEDVVLNFEYVLEELIFHNILHETNHNAVGSHDESFTIQFLYTYSEFARIGEGLSTWRKQLRNLIKQYLKDIIKDAKEYDLSTNVGESLEGRSQRIEMLKGSQRSFENNEQTIHRSEDSGILSDAIEQFVNNKLGRNNPNYNQRTDLFSGVYDMKKPYISPTIQELGGDLSEDLMYTPRKNNTEENLNTIQNALDYVVKVFNTFKKQQMYALKRLKELNRELKTNFTVQFDSLNKPIVEGLYKGPIKRSSKSKSKGGEVNKFSQYKLDSRKEGFSELMRMLNDDPELYYEYLEYLGKDVESKC